MERPGNGARPGPEDGPKISRNQLILLCFPSARWPACARQSRCEARPAPRAM